MKTWLLLSAAVTLVGCAASPTGPRVSPNDALRQASINIVQGYAEHTAYFLRDGTEDEAMLRAQKAVSSTLKDPSSAQYRNVRVKPFANGKVVCGEVNAKNSYGGYVGFTPFVSGVILGHAYKTDRLKTLEPLMNAGLFAACG